ncbi:ADP-ribosyl-[dinitrogen reductase] hydrolase [Ectothiorhodospira marina]|uniref:ADP-ribosyl-[dinitrogen reductase] hydrolase n=1 Tax=Ectothiorhodospira marina TaxID=1396821 RepID=A0A1H7MX84_9GAMM|nr:ADP-ribosyl-[dinitrogen reductase] hydrolase [Ectothiorhodospira marina]
MRGGGAPPDKEPLSPLGKEVGVRGAPSRAQAAYLALAIGDALGATVEFMMPREIQYKHGVHKDLIGGGWLHLKPGAITDDTQMSLALGDAIIQAGGLHAPTIAEAFSQWMRSRPVDIGHTVRRGIIHYRRTGQTQVPLNDNDAGNGACMRVLPIALATLGEPRETVDAACRLQAHITHHHPLSDAGTQCIVAMVQMALQGASQRELLQGPVQALIQQHPEFHFRTRREENPSGFIVHTLRAVFQALFDTDTFEDCLVDVVNRGGDADTTGAIAGMVAGALYGLEAIPERWVKGLDAEVKEQMMVQLSRLI